MKLPRAALIAASLLVLLGCKPSATPQEKREEQASRQLDALGDIADRYRKPDPSGATATGELAGRADYDDAREAVGSGDMPRAIASLKRATDADPDCAEYWYNLGAAQANHAIARVNADEDEAVRLFSDSVDSKRTALDLMKQGRFCFYDEAQQQQVRSDAEQGLADADAVLADRASLVAALRMYAGGR